jgi:hypothetical protein
LVAGLLYQVGKKRSLVIALDPLKFVYDNYRLRRVLACGLRHHVDSLVDGIGQRDRAALYGALRCDREAARGRSSFLLVRVFNKRGVEAKQSRGDLLDNPGER